jgi:hypothetical protein
MSENPFKSPFIYLLNAMENAAQERDPFKAGYAQRREEVLRYVDMLEARIKKLEAASGTHAASSQPQEKS